MAERGTTIQRLVLRGEGSDDGRHTRPGGDREGAVSQVPPGLDSRSAPCAPRTGPPVKVAPVRTLSQRTLVYHNVKAHGDGSQVSRTAAHSV